MGVKSAKNESYFTASIVLWVRSNIHVEWNEETSLDYLLKLTVWKIIAYMQNLNAMNFFSLYIVTYILIMP